MYWQQNVLLPHIRDSGIWEIFACGIHNPGVCGSQNTPKGIQNPSSTDKYWNPESAIQDCPGFPYMGRVIGSTPFVRATPFKFLSHSFSFVLLPLPTPLVRVLYHCNEYNAGNDYSFLWCISLQSSSPGPCGWGAGKGRRACNYVSGIWIPPPIPLWLPVDWAVRFPPISQKQKRARM